MLKNPSFHQSKSSAKNSMSKPVISSMIQGGKQRVHTTFADTSELIEEFDVATGVLLLRKTKPPTLSSLGSGGNQSGGWVLEVGDDDGTARGIQNSLIRPSSSTPFFTRKDTRTQFIWRIRNLPYEKPVYSVTTSPDSKKIIVRTSNKKYYTAITISDMDRLSLPLDQDSIAWDWSSNTLVITYSKPRALLEWEAHQAKERAKLPNMSDPSSTVSSSKQAATGNANAQHQDTPPECKQQ